MIGTIIYADVLFVVNFIITYFLLLTSAILTGDTYSRKRIIISSAIGAMFCFYIFAKIQNFIIDLLIKISSLLICAFIAFDFKKKKSFFMQMFCFVLLNGLLTGIVTVISQKSSLVYQDNLFFYLNINPVILVVSSAVIYITISIFSNFKEQISPQSIYMIDIIFKDFIINDVSAFYDSGCKVKDLVSNNDVIILNVKNQINKIPQYINNDINCFLKGKYDNLQTTFIPVFYSTISGKGMLPAIKAEKVIFNGTEVKNIVIAFAETNFSDDISAIFGSNIKRQL